MEVFLVVALGNPGREYEHTRHNAGFDTMERLLAKTGASLNKKMCKGLVGEVLKDGKKLVLCEPQTFMNLSGECVQELLHWYKTPVDHLMVIYDDIDLPAARVRMRKSGGPGTHNGMRSIVECTGEQGFPRMRVGTGDRPAGWDLKDWVLGRYRTAEEQQQMDAAFELAAQSVLDWVDNGSDHAMQMANQAPKGQEKDRAPQKACQPPEEAGPQHTEQPAGAAQQ